MEINGEANGHLASICNDLGAYLMYFSTDYVFNGTKEEGYKEDDSPSPINTYGTSKLRGEELIQQNTDKFFIIRTSWLFGMHGINFVKTMLDLADKKRKITVVNDQIGKPTYTKDLAKAIYSLISENQADSGIYHLVNEGETSWYDFAKKIFELAKIDVQLSPISSEELNRPAKRPRISTLLNTKLPKLRHHHEALHDYLNSLK
jgi:dTDP-4-dehydrorhamnose reductase